MSRIFDYIYKGDGSPLSGVVGWAKVLQQPVHTSGYVISYNSGVKSYSDSLGVISWYFPSGTILDITIPYIGMYNNEITVPDTDTQLSSL